MFGVHFKKDNVQDFGLAREKALKKLKGGIHDNERIDLVRTETGYKVSRRSVLFGKGGVSLEAKKFLNTLDLYAEPKARVGTVGRKDSIKILSQCIDGASKMEEGGVLWRSPTEIYTPCGFISGKPEWKVMQQVGKDGDLFVVMDEPDGGITDQMRKTLRSAVNGGISWGDLKKIEIGGSTKILIPLQGAVAQAGKFPDFVSDVTASHVTFKGKRYKFDEQAIGKVAGKEKRLIRKAVAEDGDTIVLKPLDVSSDSPELVISKKVGDGNSANILGCRGSIITAAGQYFLISDYARKGTVTEYVEKLRQRMEDGRVSRQDGQRKLYKIAHQMCLGVEQLHDLGYKHMDLKPDNFYVDEDGEGEPVVKLADFGMSARSGVVINTGRSDCLKYMSPEYYTVWSDPENRAKTDRANQLKERESGLKRLGKYENLEAVQGKRIKDRVLKKAGLPAIGAASDVHGLVASIWDICCDEKAKDRASFLTPLKLRNQRSWLDSREERTIINLIRDGFVDDPAKRPTAKVLADRFATVVKAASKT